MASILDSKPEVGDVVLYEHLKQFGFCRSQKTVNVTAAFQIGTVCDNDGDGTYSGVAAADVATLNADVVVVIDDAVYDGTTGDRSIWVLKVPVGGSAVVKKNGLAYLDTLSGAQKTTVETALAALGVKTIQKL